MQEINSNSYGTTAEPGSAGTVLIEAGDHKGNDLENTTNAGAGGINIAGDNSGEINQTVNGLRTEEWDKLLGYFDKQIETVTDEKARQMYEKMRDYAEKKDEKGSCVSFHLLAGRQRKQLYQA